MRKLGERVLPEIIPILEKGLDSPDSDQRQGVCIGLSEIMTACSRDYVSPIIDFFCTCFVVILFRLDHRLLKHNYSNSETCIARSVARSSSIGGENF